MEWLKKLGCGCLYSFILCVILFFGGLFLAGAIAGAIAGSQNPNNAAAAGRQAGEKVGRIMGPILFLVAPLVSLLIGFGVALLGVHPGGRLFPGYQPPSLPENNGPDDYNNYRG